MTAIARWIECECPTGQDFDVFEGEPNFGGPDKAIDCSACGRKHRLGDIGQFHVEIGGEILTLPDAQWRLAIDPTLRPTFGALAPTTGENAETIPLKSIEDQLADWESNVFGYGYGTGEAPILGALKTFLELCSAEKPYDHEALEAALGSATAWLLITVLIGADILEYGTSPRGAWLTEEGRALKEFTDARTVEQLVAVITDRWGDEYIHCTPDYCNCGPRGHVEGRKCPNVFWGQP